jgi:hypothetical protein
MSLSTRILDSLQELPDPVIYGIIAVGATGAVLSTIHHVRSWKPHNKKSVKLKGPEGKKIEECKRMCV